MAKRKGPWTVRETVRRFKNPWIEVCEDEVIRPDGRAGSFATVTMKAGVSVLALDVDGYVYLTSEYRYAVERESVEVVSGAIDADELPLAAARRELREELGAEAGEWIELGRVDPFTSVVNSPAFLFLAEKLTFGETEHEGTEVIRVLKVKLEEAVRMVLESEISHGPSCVLILKAELLRRRRAEAGEP